MSISIRSSPTWRQLQLHDDMLKSISPQHKRARHYSCLFTLLVSGDQRLLSHPGFGRNRLDLVPEITLNQSRHRWAHPSLPWRPRSGPASKLWSPLRCGRLPLARLGWPAIAAAVAAADVEQNITTPVLIFCGSLYSDSRPYFDVCSRTHKPQLPTVTAETTPSRAETVTQVSNKVRDFKDETEKGREGGREGER